MLACVCRPVTSTLPKPPSTSSTLPPPQKRQTNPIVVTCEPRIATATIVKKKVPGRPTAAELRAMALRQQQQIDSQHQLLAAKEQRLRFLKAQEARGAAAAAEGERLRRLRERVEAQESKLRRLRALRGQVDLQKTYNVTLSNDLDSIRALFSEKEKELSLAVAKVEALTRQLEELRRDRRGPLNLIPGSASGSNSTQQISSPAARELEKLRRELMFRNQISLQQDARLHLQREALQQRQAELRSVDQRILELQTRLQRKKASNLILQSQQSNSQQQQQHQSNQQQQHHQIQHQQHQQHQKTHQQHQKNAQNQQQQQQHRHLQSQHQQQSQQSRNSENLLPSNVTLPANVNNSNSSIGIRPSNSVYPSQRLVPRGNVAAVEPYIHTPQKSAITQTSTFLNSGNLLKQSAATANTNQQNQLIQDLTNLKLNLAHVNNSISVNHLTFAESDEHKLARQKLSVKSSGPHSPKETSELETTDSTTTTTSKSTKKNESKFQTLPYNVKPPKGSPNSVSSVGSKSNECDSEKARELPVVNSETIAGKSSTQQLTVHSIPLNSVNKSVALAVSTATTTNTTTSISRSVEGKPAVKPKAVHQIPSGNLVVPPRKPISSVAPTSVTMTVPKVIAHSPKVNMVAPNIVSSQSVDADKSRPALPPKPSKLAQPSSVSESQLVSSAPTVVSVINKAPVSEPSESLSNGGTQQHFSVPTSDSLPIKAKPLTIKKQPLSEQPRLKSATSGIKPVQYNSRRIEMPPAFLFPEIETTELKDKQNISQIQQNNNQTREIANNSSSNSSSNSINSSNAVDETDKSSGSSVNEEKSPDDIKKRVRHSAISENGKAKLTRRVSFDPLALLLDASLEGELELVKKTAMQVPNPSAANDEGITALHNAICAGHFDIVKFLVEFGCDVNAQDSDGWTPLHCAASCNNLTMVKFLVESGACLFAATLSDHETPAEKCEEDEEGFDGCSEYLYSIQEKLGILNNGEVYAVFSYEAQQPDELSFSVNDRLTILRKGDDAEREWWWAKNSSGAEGYVPRNLLGLYPRVPLQTTQNSD